MHPDLAHGWRCMICHADRAFHDTGVARRTVAGAEDEFPDRRWNVQFCLDRPTCVAYATADGPWSPPERCTITPGCEFGPHPAAAHPCGKPVRVGGPCQFCGDPTTADEHGQPVPCPKCWISFDGMNLADIKGLFALGDLSVSPVQEDQPE